MSGSFLPTILDLKRFFSILAVRIEPCLPILAQQEGYLGNAGTNYTRCFYSILFGLLLGSFLTCLSWSLSGAVLMRPSVIKIFTVTG